MDYPQLFNFATLIYGIGILAYAVAVFSEKSGWDVAASWTARLGWVVHTGALLSRWAAGGAAHPPWTNLYESLVFFTWGLVSAHLYLELRYGARWSGVFSMTTAFVGMGVAALSTHKDIEPLLPLLRSSWIYVHGVSGCLAYGFFLVASFLAVFYLLKDRVRPDSILMGVSVMAIFFLPMSAYVSPPAATWLLVGSIAAYGLQFLAGSLALAWAPGMVSAGALGGPGEKLDWARLVSRVFFALAMLGLALLIALSFALQWREHPYRLAGIVLVFLFSLVAFGIARRGESLASRLPSPERLDRLSYLGILIGFPFMTLCMISGAIWSYLAWGRYWGWDPKEIWALVTWITYAIYLHGRLIGEWSGRKSALLAIVGFFVVLFAFLGVNLVLPGPHSFAAS